MVFGLCLRVCRLHLKLWIQVIMPLITWTWLFFTLLPKFKNSLIFFFSCQVPYLPSLVCSLFAYAVNFSFFSQSLLEHQKNPKKQLQKHFQNSMVFVFSNLIFCWRVLLSFLLLLYLFTDDQCHIQQKNICQHSICHRYLFWITTLKFELWKDYKFDSVYHYCS
jgi:hypothetical protein